MLTQGLSLAGGSQYDFFWLSGAAHTGSYSTTRLCLLVAEVARCLEDACMSRANVRSKDQAKRESGSRVD